MKRTIRRICGVAWGVGVAAALVLVPAVAAAQLDEAEVGANIVTVQVFEDNKIVAEGVGVVINDQGDVLTSAGVLDAGPSVFVIDPAAGKVPADGTWKGENWELALLRAAGLTGPGLPVSVAELTPETIVYSATSTSGGVKFTRGAVGELATHVVDGEDFRYVKHNARFGVKGYGSPVVNECGEVVGVNVPNPNELSIFVAPRKIKPTGPLYALNVGEIITRLRAQGVDFVAVPDVCLSAAERAQKEKEEADKAAEEADKAAEEARKRAEEAEKDKQASDDEKEKARKEAERSKALAEAARTKAEERKQEVEAARAVADRALATVEAERTRLEKLKLYAQWGGALAAALLLLLVLFWGLSAQRKRRALRSAQARAAIAEQEASRARQQVAEIPDPAPFDCVLTGEDDSGTPYALSLRRDALGIPAGVVVGRDPAKSSHVLAETSVSRAHVRFFVASGELRVEDVGSTNGTYLNGSRLRVGEDARVRNGDELVLGSLTLRVELRG